MGTDARQFINTYMTQMKLYAKSRTTVGLFILVLTIPIVMVLGFMDSLIVDSILSKIGDTGETYMAVCLSLSTGVVALVASIVCGNILPDEFRSRTAYLHLPLPQSLRMFYFGKFMAGLTMVFMVVLFALSESIFISTLSYGWVSFKPVLEASLMITACAFFSSAFAFGSSAFLRKGSTVFSFILLFLVLPVIGLLVAGLSPSALSAVPTYGCDLALMRLGFDKSVSLFYVLMNSGTEVIPIAWISILSSLVCGSIILIIGLWETMRREM